MKVRELIKELCKYNEDHDVIFLDCDIINIFHDINTITEVDGEVLLSDE